MAKKGATRKVLTDAEKAERQADKAGRFRKWCNRRLAKFERLAVAIQNLANKSTYAYTDEQAEVVMTVCKQAVVRICDAFNQPAKAPAADAVYV